MKFQWDRARPVGQVRLPFSVTPDEVVGCLDGSGPMVWLDAACAGGWRATVLAHGPALEVTGRLDSAADLQRLRALVGVEPKTGGGPEASVGGGVQEGQGRSQFSDHIVVGAVEFDGSFWFARFSRVLWHDPVRDQWYGSEEMAQTVRQRRGRASAGAVTPWLRFEQSTGASEFASMVRKAQEWIAAGDIYQVNLAREYLARWPETEPGAELALFRRMRSISPAPHSCFLDLGPGRRKVLSVSPETFLRFDGGRVETQPIKGTRPRGAGPGEDLRLARELMACPKERAELVMITDLLRNDLGRVCEFGSIKVPELLSLKRFSHVQHLMSSVTGLLREGVDAWDVLAACSPGGSISGAPKLRALEVIAELEKDPRGLYTGSIGWLDGSGRGEFSIAIRTLVIESGRAHFHVGAGLVADSIPEREFQETCDKAAGLLQACARPV